MIEWDPWMAKIVEVAKVESASRAPIRKLVEKLENVSDDITHTSGKISSIWILLCSFWFILYRF